MNNTTVFDNNSIWIFEQIYQPLYTVTNDGKGVKPWLATSYKMSPDKKTYTFTLRKGVKFSNGKPMTSADVKFSIDQNSRRRKGWGLHRHGHQVGRRALAPDTVVVHLKYPWAPLLADLSLFANGIVPDNYGGESETAVLQPPDRHRPVQVGLLEQGPGAQAGQEPQLLAEGQAVPEQRHLDRRAGRQHPAAAAQGRPGADRRVPGLVHGRPAEVHARGHDEPVQLDADQLHVLQREAQAVPGRARAPGDLAARSTGRRWSRRCCSATASRPTRCSRRRCRSTTRPRPACSSTWPRRRRRWPSPASRTASPPRCSSRPATRTTRRSPRSCSRSSSRSASTLKIQQLDPNTANTDSRP